jgi:hypothetical protein
MSCSRRPTQCLRILVPKDFDVNSIQKCPIDFYCNFIPLDDDAANEEAKLPFVVLQRKYFIAHLAGREVKCDYNCRNRVLSYLYKVIVEYRYYIVPQGQKMIDNNFGIDLIHGTLYNNEPPHMVFTREGLRFSDKVDDDTNCIMENYTTLDLQNFAEITKSKPCNHNFFVVYLGPTDDSSHRYMCCNMKTFETYEYGSAMKSRIEKMLHEDVDAGIRKWEAEDQALDLKKPAKRTPNFRLVDNQGNPVKEDTDYLLQMYDQPEDVLKDGDYASIFYATYRLNRSSKIVVRFCIIDGIHYLTYNGKFLQAVEDMDEFGYTEEEEIPEKEQRLEFHVTENNTFKTVKWDNTIWLTSKKKTLNFTSLIFDEDEDVVRWGKPLELMLNKI